MTFPEYITVFRQNLFCRLANSRFLYITIKNPDTWRYPDYIVAGCPCRDLRQMITLLLVPQLLEQPQRPSSSYDECSS